MNASLFDTAPDFDQPIAVLKHCHDRIRKQLRTMQQLAGPAAREAGAEEVQQAAAAVLRYFSKSAHQHHEDEEHNLLPMLAETAADADAALLKQLTPEILHEHQQMDAVWQRLQPQLAALASGADVALDGADVKLYQELYLGHMDKEESQIAPMAKRLFSPAQMQTLGNAMRARRGIATPDKGA
jgi:pyridoxamine 5'-phosphate oxidase